MTDRLFVAFDTETTGLISRHEHVVEIAGVRFTGSGHEISHFSTLANPGTHIAPESTRIHGISDDMVIHAPGSVDAVHQFTGWLSEDDILVAHNAAFDVTFVGTELSRGGFTAPRNTVIDSLRLMRELAPGVPNYRLQTLAEHFQLPKAGFHRALSDSLHVKGLLMRFLEASGDSITLEKLRSIAGVASFYDMTSGQLNQQPRFSELSETIEQGEIIQIRYDTQKSRGIIQQRVLPLNLCRADGVDYLVAQDMSDGRVHQFKLANLIEFDPPRNPLRHSS